MDRLFEILGPTVITEFSQIRLRRDLEFEVSRSEYVAVIGSRATQKIPKTIEALKKAIKNKVKVRLLFNLTKSNLENVREFAQNGASVRHYPALGFIFAIIDGANIRIEINALEEDRRLAICLNDRALGAKLKEYFEGLWKKAIPFRSRENSLLQHGASSNEEDLI